MVPDSRLSSGDQCKLLESLRHEAGVQPLVPVRLGSLVSLGSLYSAG